MKPPQLFKYHKDKRRMYSYSLCIACDKWVKTTNIFFHEGRLWHLCITDFFDYWENTDELLPDYEAY